MKKLILLSLLVLASCYLFSQNDSETEKYDKSPASKSLKVKNKDDHYPAIIKFNGGYSKRTASTANQISSEFRDYYKNLKSGFHIGADFIYFLSEKYAIGLKYSFCYSSNSMNDIYIQDSLGNAIHGKMSDKIKLSFIGPSFSTNFLKKNRNNNLIMTVSLGRLGYKNDAVLINMFKLTSSTAGYVMDLSYDFKLSDIIYGGLQLSYTAGVLDSFVYDDGYTTEKVFLNEGEYESLGRVDISVGLRVYL